MTYKAVVFSLEDAVLDFSDLELESVNEVLSEFSVHISKGEWKELYKEQSPLDVFQELIHTHHLNLTPTDALKSLFQVRRRLIDEFGLDFVAGFTDVLDYLKNKEVKIVFCSSLPQHHLDFLLKKAKLNSFSSLPREQYKLPRPSSDCYEKLLSLLDLEPSQVLIIEGSEQGVLASQALKLRTLLISQSPSQHTSTVSHYKELDYATLLN